MNPDAIVVGAGPNGLAAAITMARAGLSVRVIEAESTIGGGARTEELTLPGFKHDTCSAIHPFGYASPVFRSMPLESHGLRWINPPAAMSHLLDDGSVPTLEVSVVETARELGEDAETYQSLFAPAAARLSDLLEGGLRRVAPHALSLARLGMLSLRSGSALISKFRTQSARALLAGLAGHALLPLNKSATAAVAIALATAGHVGGWPFPEGGAQKISDAMESYLRSLGGEIETNSRVRDLRELPSARVSLLDLTPRQVLEIAGDQLPRMYAQVLRNYQYALAAFKVDWALSDPVPWRSKEAARAATLHIGGTYEEVAVSQREAWFGRTAERPFVIAAQHTLFDRTRAPEGKHTFWAYCHVPNSSSVDMTERIEAQIERFAPGFRDCILGRSIMSPRQLEAHDSNLVGGDVVGGSQEILQLLIRPSLRYWTTPLDNVFLCSASTPPGGGVHGMCGYLAAKVALKRRFGLAAVPIYSDAA